MNKKYILGIDEGTTLVKAALVDRNGREAAFGSCPIPTIVPKDGHFEQNPLLIWNTTYGLILEVLSKNSIHPGEIAAIGIANQRETTVFWNRKTGEPYGPAVVWLDKRAAPLCEGAIAELGQHTLERVGMYVIPNTAGMIVKWLLENDSAIRKAVRSKEACFGTINSWLLWKLTGGESHGCDLANMSITLLQDAKELCYDKPMLDYLGLPMEALPELRGTGEIFGTTSAGLFSGEKIPVAGMLGDQMAAALGQGCISKGMAKNTYGTGSFSVMNIGPCYLPPSQGLFASFLWGAKDNPHYALEGFSEICGAAVDWLMNNMKMIRDPAETEKMSRSAAGSEPLYFVPAFKGLGTPYLDHYARGAVFGITSDTTAEQMVQAVLNGIVYQTTDVIRTMEKVTGQEISTLRVDGGMAKNDYVCQFQADMLNKSVERPVSAESTVLGAAYQAGLTVGFWNTMEETASLWKLDRRFEPQYSKEKRGALYAGWLEAVRRAKGWMGAMDSCL